MVAAAVGPVGCVELRRFEGVFTIEDWGDRDFAADARPRESAMLQRDCGPRAERPAAPAAGRGPRQRCA
eukprot:6639929-Lingulodinium_polyedra.AAC.1